MTQPFPDDQQEIIARARLAAIVECSDDAIISKGLDGIIASWNKGAERIFGYTAEEVIGKPMTTLFPLDRYDEETHILTRIQRGERVDHFETIRLAKDGRQVEVSVTVSPIRDSTGRIVGASKIARDITLQKQREKDLRQARDMAEAANRAKDHFLSVLSHELRTPLTPVLAAVTYLEITPQPAAEDLRLHLEMIRRNVETEARLVDDLLDITRISRGKIDLHKERLDAHVAVRDVVSMLQSEIDLKGLSVTTALRAKDHHVWADPGRFQQILLNLLSNAVKFTPPDGTIAIRTSNDNGHGHGLTLEVSDNGVGIEPGMLPRLFEPFEQGEQTVTRKFGGLGLGLSIVRALMDMHGGSISALSEGLGKGSTFILRLETAVPVEPQSTRQPPAADSPATAVKPCRILLVEDHDDTREMLKRLLTSYGCSVTAAPNVHEALEHLSQQHFDLLVSDIGLPDGSGLDIMQEVRARYGIPGIALSGFGQDDDLRRSRDAGFKKHLIKPVNFDTLREMVRVVCS